MKSLFKKILTAILALEARTALVRNKPRIIAVTGNVGKTSTKDAIFTVMSAGNLKARKSNKSFNSEIGLPLAILGLENAWSSPSGWAKNIFKGAAAAFSKADFPEWLVLEVGADHPGDIKKISKWLRPDIVVLTRMSSVPVHVEFFKNPEEVLEEKMHLARALKEGGTLVVNADDSLFMEAAKGISAKKIFYGESGEASVRIIKSEVIYGPKPLFLPIGQYVTAQAGKGSEGLKIELYGVVGKHLVYPAVSAVAVALELGLLKAVSGAFKGFVPAPGRMRLLSGVSSSVIIDDTYNSSPLACMEALKTLGSISTKGKKIAVLGDMKELGEFSEKAHREAGALAGEIVHTLVTVGEAGKFFAEGALAAGLSPDRVIEAKDSVEAGNMVREMLRAGDIVLVKGSQSMRMERAVILLLAEGQDADGLLVRQEKEWLNR